MSTEDKIAEARAHVMKCTGEAFAAARGGK